MSSTIVHTAARALSMDVALVERLSRDVIRGEVDSVFAHAVNLRTFDGGLVSLCTRDLDDAPWSVRLDLAGLPGGLEVGAAATLTLEGITFDEGGWMSIGFADVEKWNPILTPLRADSATLVARLGIVQQLLDARGVRGGVLTPQGDAADPFATAVARELGHAVDALLTAERGRDERGVSAAVLRMLGLGPGLTPAGDDVLTGLALVAAQPGSRIALLRGALSAALRDEPQHTTLLATVTILQALRGRARQRLLDLMDRLAGPVTGRARDDCRVMTAAEHVLGIGHTSGTDILSGILAGLRLERELGGSA